MPDSAPEVVVRIGSHAEKDYILKLARYFDGLIVGANLFEATPAATASLLYAVKAKDTKVYLDPMTYAFGAYVDPKTKFVRTDLDWIKSEQAVKDNKGKKKTVRDFKRSYRQLSEAIGSPLTGAVDEGRAILPETMVSKREKSEFCRRTSEYQLNRIGSEFEKDEQLKQFLQFAPKPAATFAPYFYVEPTYTSEWLKFNLELMRISAELKLGHPTHGILCADISHLKDAAIRKHILAEIPKTGVDGIWLWFSGFFENTAEESTLVGYRDLVQGLALKMEVHAMHGGFLSLALSKYGMRGVSHGVGYGEQKDVVPVIGQSTPTVRYYLPPVAQRLGVPDIERSFDAMGINTPNDFHEKICDCPVCKGVVAESLRSFSSFGEMHRSRPEAKRLSQTPSAAKRCRFHFLLSRIKERDFLRASSIDDIVKALEEASSTWGDQPTLKSSATHLTRWSSVIKAE
jgi:hypothetical protein